MAFWGLGSRSQTPNKLGSIQVGTSEYGAAIPIGWGNFKASLKLLDLQGFYAVAQSAGGKGGSVSSYEYYADVIAMLCQGPIAGFGNVYGDGGSSTLLAASETYTIPAAGGAYQVVYYGYPFYNDEGVTFSETYSTAADDFGSDGSITLAGSQSAPLESVDLTTTTPGPGQYGTTDGGNYTFGPTLSGQPLTVTILYTYTTADTSGGPGTSGYDARSPAQRFNIGELLGTTPQTPWDLYVSKYAANAIAYTGLACMLCGSMDLGSDATVPNISIEILNGRLKSFGSGISDCDPAVIIADILSDAVAGCGWPWLADLTLYSNFCVANSLFMSLYVDSVRKATELIDEICELTNSAAVWSGQSLKIIPYGDTTAVGNGRTFTPPTQPVYEIDESECLCKAGEEAIKQGWQDLADNYNSVQFEYTNRADNYNTALIHERDTASILTNGLLPMKTVTAHHYCVQYYAAVAMNMLLKRNSTPLATWEFTLPWYYQLLEPMDIIVMNLKLGNRGITPMRIVSVEEQDDYSLKVLAEDFLFGVAEGVVYPKGTPSGFGPGANDAPGNTTLQAAYQPPPRITGGASELWLALTGNAPWGGCEVFLSLDDVTFSSIGKQYGSSRAGTLTAALALGSDPDTTDTAAVTVTGSLTTVSQAECDANVTLSLVGAELVSYETATLTGSTSATNSYNLGTRLRRGVFSTAIQAHGIGERFMRLDDQVFKYTLDPSLIGKTIYLKLASFNFYGLQEQQLSSIPSIAITIAGVTPGSMSVGSFANSTGGQATVDVFLPGAASGASGYASLANGATVTLPAYSWTTLALGTWYGVNFNPTTSAYVLYTDQNAWMADQLTMIAIGSTTTPASTTVTLYPDAFADSGSASTTNPAGAYTSGQTSTVNSSASYTPPSSGGGGGGGGGGIIGVQ